MLRTVLVIVAGLGVTMGGTSVRSLPTLFYTPVFHHTPTIFHNPSLLMRQVPEIRSTRDPEDANLPCPVVGFYNHPRNCSRFYRCVDFTGTGKFFVRYVFECPSGHTFSVQAATCIPSICRRQGPVITPVQTSNGSPVQLTPETPVQPPPDTPVQPPPDTQVQQSPDTPQQTPIASPVQPPTASPFQPDGPTSTTQPITEASTPEESINEISDQNEPTTGTPTEASTTRSPLDEACKHQYVQHVTHCNVYYQCDIPGVRYVCPAGTVFDQRRQMCRLSSYDEGLCMGKAILPVNLLRTELVDGHLQLPDSFQLPLLAPPSMIQGAQGGFLRSTSSSDFTVPVSLYQDNVPSSLNTSPGFIAPSVLNNAPGFHTSPSFNNVPNFNNLPSFNSFPSFNDPQRFSNPLSINNPQSFNTPSSFNNPPSFNAFHSPYHSPYTFFVPYNTLQ
ncbi:hypothetical protein OTU49_003669 [Cherax quadricarinatus]|uniref:Chitin-binding type-2 domain-containing protein n=1 Tax=Cherax quadricarinatus TaxID=27406 RepID=A0AAW0X2J0_CHEQU